MPEVMVRLRRSSFEKQAARVGKIPDKLSVYISGTVDDPQEQAARWNEPHNLRRWSHTI